MNAITKIYHKNINCIRTIKLFLTITVHSRCAYNPDYKGTSTSKTLKFKQPFNKNKIVYI